MQIFLLVFFLIYGLYHLYFFIKVRPTKPFTVPLVLWLALMTAAPLLTRVAERQGHEMLARVMAVSGYAWMGFVFEFFCLGLALDLLLFLVRTVSRWFSPVCRPRMSPRAFLLTIGTISLVVCVYGYWAAHTLQVRRVTISTDKPLGTNQRLKIVQISDLHLGVMIGESFLKQVIDLVALENPDLLVATGDIVDGQGDGLASLSGQFLQLQPRLGKFAATGNHEFYMGLDNSLGFLKEAGFTVLRNRTQNVQGILDITGVDDLSASYFPGYIELPESGVLGSVNGSERFHLFLKHRPVVETASLGLFDLQLSGHVHGGQLFPFNYITGLKFPWPVAELVSLRDGYLYVSRGTGTWGPPIRIFAPPEITVIEIVFDGEGGNKVQ